MDPEIALRPLKRIYNRIRKRWAAHRNRRADFSAYTCWLKRHPEGNYGQFYVASIERHLAGKGGSHSTLGPHPVWEGQGDAILQRLIALGLRQNDLVVDYGCGTLREGIHLIRYLEAGQYVGLDIDERVLEAGRHLAGAELLAEKKPHLAVVTPAVVAQTAAAKPAWIVSSYVISQMPAEALDAYFDSLAKLMEGGGKALLQLRLAWRTKQCARTGWFHDRRRVARRLADRGLKVLEITTRPLLSKPYRVRGVDARLIVGKKPQQGQVRHSHLQY